MLALAVPGPAVALSVKVKGDHLVDQGGDPVRLLGVNRSGTEYACAQGWGMFDSPHPDTPDDDGMIRAMRSWKINAVRVPLNELCWLGVNGVDARYGGEPYRRAIAEYVDRLRTHRIYAIIDLHSAAPGATPASTATGWLIPMPDASHAPEFWRSVARRFGGDRNVVFDLYNEPHDISWECLRDGCTVTHNPRDPETPPYRAVGFQELVDVIRAADARNVIMAAGLGYSNDLSEWLRWRPRDPRNQLAASFHNYEGPDIGACFRSCWKRTIAPIARRLPVVTGEFGDSDLSNQVCNHDYIDRFMPWADRHGVSYLAWTWDATRSGSWQCGSGPALIFDYDGTPTETYGRGFRHHLRRLARR